MKTLITSNMYPGPNSYFGIFVKHQIEALEEEGIEFKKNVRKQKTTKGYVLFVLRSILYSIFPTYDLVHSHYGFHSALVHAILKIKPLIVTYHGSDALQEPFRNRFYYRFQKFVVSKADHIIVVSDDIKWFLKHHFNASLDKISVISCGVNTSVFKPYDRSKARKIVGIDQNRKVVLFVGKISFMKGADVIYECARMMPDVLFILAGDGKFRKNIDNCKFIGSVSNEKMPIWYNASDVFVLPSRTEGVPVVLMEALACGVPVISSKVGGCTNLVKEGQTGFLIDIDNPYLAINRAKFKYNSRYTLPRESVYHLKEKILFLLENPDRRINMGQLGRRDMLKNYDNHKIAKKIKVVYSNVINHDHL